MWLVISELAVILLVNVEAARRTVIYQCCSVLSVDVYHEVVIRWLLSVLLSIPQRLRVLAACYHRMHLQRHFRSHLHRKSRTHVFNECIGSTRVELAVVGL